MSSQNILIIGGSHGIGYEVVRDALKDGHSVWAFSRTVGNLKLSKQLVHKKFDILTDAFPLEDLPEVIHALVYCPGTITLKPFNRLSDADFDTDYQINVKGAVHVIRAVLPRLRKAKPGASVVMFSTVAVQTGMRFHASIAAAKGAVEGLVRSLAAELAPRVRVNAVAPSITDTPLADRILNSADKVKMSSERHPLRRVGNPGDIARAVRYLRSDDAGWITGEILHVDGGMTAVRVF